jgi:hypothetical protein
MTVHIIVENGENYPQGDEPAKVATVTTVNLSDGQATPYGNIEPGQRVSIAVHGGHAIQITEAATE